MFGRRFLVWLIGALGLLVAVLALRGAVSWYHRPFVGVLLDADGTVSSFGLPTWGGLRSGLRYPDRIVEVDGMALSSGARSGEELNQAVVRAAARGHERVHVRVESRGKSRELDLTLERLGGVAWWWLAGLSIFIGLLYIGGGMIAMAASPRGPLARTFAKSAFVGGMFMLSLFDVHTTRLLVPVWSAAFAMLPAACIGLALRLPDNLPVLERYPWIIPALDAIGALVAAVTVGRELLGLPTTSLHAFCSGAFGAALVILPVTVLVRFLRARGQRRAALSSLITWMVPVYALMGASILVTLLAPSGLVLFFAVLPLLSFAPLVTGYAYVRHDLWRADAVISRVVTLASIGTLSCLLALALGAALAAGLGVPLGHALLAATCGSALAAVLVSSALRVTDRTFFPTLAGYKPTIDQLSEDLLGVASPAEVVSAIERLVVRWLPCERVVLELASRGVEAPEEVLHGHELTLPVLFRRQPLATLRVRRAADGTPFTSEDADLLHTITNLAALALAHANAYAELEKRRKQQVAAGRGERLAILETLAAEIAHEVRYPINFFKAVFARTDPRLDSEELEIGREEVDRLERLVAGFRPLATQHVSRGLVSLRELAERAAALVGDALGTRDLDVDVPAEISLRCDADKVTQVLVNLLANAIEATGGSDRLGIRWSATPTGGLLRIWDTGRGFEGDGAQLFVPWFTTKAGGTGLGLSISHRFARSHGWSLDVSRVEGLTRFDIVIPASDIVLATSGSEKHS